MSSSSSSSSTTTTPSRAYARVATYASHLTSSACAAATVTTPSTDRVVIVSSARTPLGSFNGALSHLTAPELAGIAMKACLTRATTTSTTSTPLDLSVHVDEVFLGHVLSGDVGQAPATQAALKAGLSMKTPCTSINKVCASGMKALQIGAMSIQTGQRKCVLVGGMESMSKAPFYLSDMRTGKRFRLGEEKIKDAVISDGLTDKYYDVHMGTAAELCAQKFKISRQDQDAFAKQSYQRAQAATKAGYFDKEIVPITIKNKGKDTILKEDEEVFRVNFDRLSTLRTAFPAQLKNNPQPKELLPADYKEDKNAKGTVTGKDASLSLSLSHTHTHTHTRTHTHTHTETQTFAYTHTVASVSANSHKKRHLVKMHKHGLTVKPK